MRVFLTTLFAITLSACSTLGDRTSEALHAPGLEGTRWGLVVMTMDGRELIAIRPDERFTPASNTKLFTAAAAFHRLGDLTMPDPSMGTSVRIVPRAEGPPDLVLVGGGDAMLIDAADCERDCLSSLADMVVANGVTRINDVIGDDRLYPEQPWAPGWSWEDLVTRSGAATSALTVNSNEVALVVKPGVAAGEPADVTWRASDVLGGGYPYDLRNDVVTVAADADDEDLFGVERLGTSSTVRAYGQVVIGSTPRTIPVAVTSPAGSAAWRMEYLLKERGVTIEGDAATAHRPVVLVDDPELRKGAAPPSPHREGVEIARLLPPPLIEDVALIMKQSQNLHAELLLRRLGLIEGGGSIEDGVAIIEQMLGDVGADRAGWDFSDGSGMSIYNRVTPRTVARLLLWTSRQAWAEAFRATLPVGGVDGTLRRRFAGTSLEGRVFAKTGTLTAVNALSGFMLTKSGQVLIFSAYANDRPSQAGSAIAAMDAALVQISETN
ncbi:MAG TPA: D-alanyl-D-alanine carboxypeptidase/D-alanyl-D-alanine-endopeptidase [Hyphomonadaceae bacterium]|nr:D-alanyl-D-alanine carboxypeptidase/D-alanyl-D-alanine-endopeptidase [Hyphomonadaceae bacterium]HPI48942.1 D-alanyl-D-alanine carboxypeptidase/D-alanyl-D-alanine-endopeptidase [Hyphomonadaceae bacterium]